MDKMMTSVSGPECLVVDGDDIRMDGEYEGLRQGEWGRALQKLQTVAMHTWHVELFQNNMSCGRLMLHCGGPGHNISSRVRVGPFLT